MRKIYRGLLVILTFIIVISSVSCSGEQYVADDTSEPTTTDSPGIENDISEPVFGGVLRLATTKYSSLNPLITDSEDIRQYMSLVYSNFISLDYSGKPTPEIAKNWSSDDNGVTWTFKLRTDAKWHDGGVADSEDIVSTINFIKTNGGNYSENVKKIKSFKATDSETVEIVCNEPCSILPCLLSFPVLKAENIKDAGKNPIGSGIYSFDSARSTKDKVYLRNFDGYFGEKPYIEAVEISTYASNDEKYKAESGFSVIYDGVMKASYLKEGVITYKISGDEFTGLWFNLNSGATSDIAVRKAIQNYVDRADLIKAGAYGHAESALYPVKQGTFLYDGDKVPSSPDKVLGDELMGIAGYSKNSSGMWAKNGSVINAVCLVPANDTGYLLLAERLKKNLGKNGISVTLKYCTTSEYADLLKKGSYSIALMGTSFDTYTDFESAYKTGGKYNINSYSNADVDKLITDSEKITNQAELQKTYSEIAEKVGSDSICCGLYVKNQLVVTSEKLHGIESNTMYSWDIFASVHKWYIE